MGTASAFAFTAPGLLPSGGQAGAPILDVVAARDWNGTTLTPAVGSAFVTHGTVPTSAAVPGFYASGIGPFSDVNFLDRAAANDEVDTCFASGCFCTAVVAVGPLDATTIVGTDSSGVAVADGSLNDGGWWANVSDATGMNFISGVDGPLSNFPTLAGRRSIALVSWGVSGTHFFQKTNLGPTSNIVSVATGPGTLSKLTLGRRGDATGSSFNGAIYELKCYQTAPTATLLDALHLAVEHSDIAILGDSITEGYQTLPGSGQRLQTLLGRASVVTNGSVVGYQTSSILSRWTNDTHLKGFSRLLVGGGVNDIGNSVATGTIESNLQSVWDGARADGLNPVLIGVLPEKGSTLYPTTAPIQTAIDAVNAFEASYAITNSLTRIDAFTIFNDNSSARFLNSTMDCGDGLHPGQAGQTLLGTREWQAYRGASQVDAVSTSPLFDRDASTVLHIVWPTDGGDPIDLEGHMLTKHGSPLVVAAGVDSPAGGTGWSDANYFTASIPASFPDTVCVAVNSADTASFRTLFSASTWSTGGFLVQQSGVAPGGIHIAVSGTTTSESPNKLAPLAQAQASCFGASATNSYAGSSDYTNVFAYTSANGAPSGNVAIGRYADGTGFSYSTGTIYEIWVTQTDPATLSASFPAIQSKALVRVRGAP